MLIFLQFYVILAVILVCFLEKGGRLLKVEFRVGIGYDVHKLVTHRKLILGGVCIPFEKGLLGHSDADVLVHSIMDALLGAMGKGDIGRHFPDTDEKYKGISSLTLLSYVKDLLDTDGFCICNIDSVVVAQKPKLSTYIKQMEYNICECLGVDEGIVNIKATTEEELGFTGSGEGIAAKAICSLKFEKGVNL